LPKITDEAECFLCHRNDKAERFFFALDDGVETFSTRMNTRCPAWIPVNFSHSLSLFTIHGFVEECSNKIQNHESNVETFPNSQITDRTYKNSVITPQKMSNPDHDV
jgi:hypothetical protein